MNKSDSERMAGYLEEYGLSLTEKRSEADLVIINTCGVRQSAEDRIYGLVPKIKKENKKVKIILTGCLSQRKDVKKRLEGKVDFWFPIVELPKLAKILGLDDGKTSEYDYLKIKAKYNSKISAFVPIGNGCNNFCAYCVVPYARGREKYRSANEIVKEVEYLVKNGYKEINLIAQNVNSYQSKMDSTKKTRSSRRSAPQDDKGIVNFAKLLEKVNDIPGNFWIRFSTSHPKDMSDELIKTIATCKKVVEHIHLPAQAGDNKVLEMMNRNYTRENYIKLVNKIKKVINNQETRNNNQKNSKFKIQNSKFCLPVSISTDIMVGFLGETRKQFENTKKLFREVKFDLAYISQYSPRFGTTAYKLEDKISKQEKKRREEELMKILRKTALKNNKKYIGKSVEILVTGKNKEGKYFGMTRTYKNVKIHVTQNTKHETNLIGKFVDVKINKVKDFGLEGELVES